MEEIPVVPDLQPAGLHVSGLGLNFTIRRHIIIDIESIFCGHEEEGNI